MADWPNTLPCQPLLEALSFVDEPNVVEFKPDVGRAQRSKRYTRDRERIEATLALTRPQMEILRTFYRTDCESGVVAFSMKDWRFGTDALFTWASSPEFSRRNGRSFMVSVSLFME